MKAYIIGQHRQAADADLLAHELADRDIAVVSSWHDEDADNSTRGAEEIRYEIDAADVVIALAATSRGGGVATELGYALGKGKSVIVVGEGGSALTNEAIRVESLDKALTLLDLTNSLATRLNSALLFVGRIRL